MVLKNIRTVWIHIIGIGGKIILHLLYWRWCSPNWTIYGRKSSNMTLVSLQCWDFYWTAPCVCTLGGMVKSGREINNVWGIPVFHKFITWGVYLPATEGDLDVYQHSLEHSNTGSRKRSNSVRFYFKMWWYYVSPVLPSKVVLAWDAHVTFIHWTAVLFSGQVTLRTADLYPGVFPKAHRDSGGSVSSPLPHFSLAATDVLEFHLHRYPTLQ